MNQDAALIIPAYNEGSVIADVINEAVQVFPNIVCIDDGSVDQTANLIEATKAKLIRHPINMGQGAALQTGFEYARSLSHIKYFVTFDADGQHRLTDAEAMVEILRKNEADIVIGSRFLDNKTQVGIVKKLILKLATIFGNWSSGTKLTDAHNGLRAFNRKFVNDLNITMPDMAHASEITVLIGNSGLVYKEVPVTIDYTDYSKAKGQSLWNAVNIIFDLVFSYSLRRKK